MQASAPGITPGAAVEQGAALPCAGPRIDVSLYAHSALMFGDVWMDAEAFGVCVSRRIDACVHNLTFDERARLLDVLTHGRRKQLECVDVDQVFSVYLVSSDARDRQPRNTWLTLSRTAEGSFLIGLSDV